MNSSYFSDMIHFENISLSFSEKIIFDNLTITINQGEKICLSGPSGRGKSTLLNLLQGYVLPNKGKIIINGKVLNDSTIREIRKQIISIPQNINLPVKNGMELVELLEISQNLHAIKEYNQKLDLESDILIKDFAKISGGQKQRLLISICLSQPKDIILMDEPTSSLDDKSIELLINVIGELKGRTIISASHNQLWAKSSDKIIEL
ncbi:ATP-binding cassette domain-containing protein [Prolixibacteraceae bacterium Z1-6]|uniref:ATP-binding cassette domain-containing protein n=1 Tax=Draconibacterium aestuarii TaxID=2998507 RepID=A0A9X3F3T1_9BACT|nr:ATP-binding cassette domain-containing protein [Prolixibacteraceae bacterium Z1-6]